MNFTEESFFQVWPKKSLQSLKIFFIRNQATTNFVISLLSVFLLTFLFIYYKEGENIMQNYFDEFHKPDLKMSIFQEPAKQNPKTIYQKFVELAEMAINYLG